jgi:AAA15 family ATPase/GTPase
MKKIKVEFCDGNGDQVTVAVSGQFSKEKILQIIDIFDKGISTKSNFNCQVTKTSMDKIIELIKTRLSSSWFTSKDVSLMYAEQYHEPIKPSTISTYLTRLYTNGYIERKGNRACWTYKLVLNFHGNVGSLIDDLKQK